MSETIRCEKCKGIIAFSGIMLSDNQIETIHNDKMLSQAKQYKERKAKGLKPILTEYCDKCYYEHKNIKRRY